MKDKMINITISLRKDLAQYITTTALEQNKEEWQILDEAIQLLMDKTEENEE